MRTSGRALAAGVIWSLFGEGLPLAIALFTIPHLVEGYGTARFGVLALVWVAIGYFGLFDLGMGRALTQLVASNASQRDREGMGPTIWTALAIMGALGLAGGILLAILTPWLVEDVLTMPGQLFEEARASFLLVAISIPLLIISQGLRGVLEAKLKFNVINTINMPLSSMTFLGPFLLLAYSNNLVLAVAAVVLSRIAGGALYFRFCLKFAPEMQHGFRFSPRAVLPLLRFGSWMTVSNIVGPLMVYLDRFVIGAIASVTATAYYSAPYDLVSRLSFVPRAFAGVLFPAFATSSNRDPEKIAHLYVRGAKYVFLVLLPPIFLIVVFAPELLNLWLGPTFSHESAQVLRILALGVLANSVAYIPFALIQGFARADVTAKLHLAEAPFYLALLWWSVSTFGIEGAAAAWSLRVTADMVLLFLAARRIATGLTALLARVAAALAAACIVTMAVATLADPTIKFASAAAIVAVYLVISWHAVLSADERRYLLSCGRTPKYPAPEIP
jgi:O-antigen/teichoic acid export membrane protein